MIQSRQKFDFSCDFLVELFTLRVEQDSFDGVTSTIQSVPDLIQNEMPSSQSISDDVLHAIMTKPRYNGLSL